MLRVPTGSSVQQKNEAGWHFGHAALRGQCRTVTASFHAPSNLAVVIPCLRATERQLLLDYKATKLPGFREAGVQGCTPHPICLRFDQTVSDCSVSSHRVKSRS
jgi:hypothetical protein